MVEVGDAVHLHGILNQNGRFRLITLNNPSLVAITVWERIGSTALLEEAYLWVQASCLFLKPTLFSACSLFSICGLRCELPVSAPALCCCAFSLQSKTLTLWNHKLNQTLCFISCLAHGVLIIAIEKVATVTYNVYFRKVSSYNATYH